jgi:hypothetical protein
VLRVFLEVEGELRTRYQWHALYPPAPGVLDSAARFVKQVVGLERAAPSPLDVAQPASASRDVYRLVREQVAQLTGTLAEFSVTPEERALRDQGVSPCAGVALPWRCCGAAVAMPWRCVPAAALCARGGGPWALCWALPGALMLLAQRRRASAARGSLC